MQKDKANAPANHNQKAPASPTPTREQILERLWQLANLSPEATRGNVNGQIKAMSMIVAMECLIPNKYNTRPEPAPAPETTQYDFYRANWNRGADSMIEEDTDYVEAETPDQAIATRLGPSPTPFVAEAANPGDTTGNIDFKKRYPNLLRP